MRNLIDFVHIEKSVIEPDTIQTILENNQNENIGWERHSWSSYDPNGGYTMSHQEGCLVKSCQRDPLFPHMEIQNCISKSVNNYAEKIRSNMPSNLGVHFSTPLRLNRYQKGVSMNEHADHIHSIFDGQAKGIPIMSLVAQLKDADQGGDFYMFGDTKLDFTAGDILIFPSVFLYSHRVEEIVEGEKWSMVSWFY